MEKRKVDRFNVMFRENEKGYLWAEKDGFPKPTNLESIEHLSDEEIKRIVTDTKRTKSKK